jgi:hypothetical protein
MPPIALTDSQMMAILAAAAPLAAHDRNPFLMEVAELLQALPEVGDGALHRVIMQVQRRHFDPGRGKRYPLSALQSAPQSPVSIVCPSLRRDNHSPSLSAVVR